MNAAIVSPTSPLNAVPRTLRDNDIYGMWCLGSRPSTIVLADCHYADS
jgi:hypothetical protein